MVMLVGYFDLTLLHTKKGVSYVWASEIPWRASSDHHDRRNGLGTVSERGSM